MEATKASITEIVKNLQDKQTARTYTPEQTAW